MVARPDLSRFEQRALANLSHDEPSEQAVGIELGTLPRSLYPAIFALVDRELAEVKLGWRGTVWARLTTAGRLAWEGRQPKG